MKYSVLTVEPDPMQRRQIIHALIEASYDAIPVHYNYALHELHSLRDLDKYAPNAVVFSDQLPHESLAQLSHYIAELEDIVLIGFGCNASDFLFAKQVARSTGELLKVLNECLYD